MDDRHKTKAQLIEELNQSQQKVARLRELNHLHRIQLEVASQAILMTDFSIAMPNSSTAWLPGTLWTEMFWT